jgi:hypothetical protein
MELVFSAFGKVQGFTPQGKPINRIFDDVFSAV